MPLDKLLTEEELEKQGFKKIRQEPCTASEFGEELVRLLSEDCRNIQIYSFYIGGKDNNQLYTIHYRYI